MNDTRDQSGNAWYYSTLTVHPTNPDVIFAPQVSLLKSIDGGKTFATVSGPHHGDHHDLWIDPKNPNRMINTNDGGVDITTDSGKTWAAPALPISQGYHVGVDNQNPYRVLSCLQDIGSASGPSRSLKTGGIGAGDWYGVGGGEAGFAVPDPSDPNIVYAGEYGGIMTRYDHRTGQSRNITVNQFNASGIDPSEDEVPVPVDRPDSHLQARPEDRLPRCQCSLPHSRWRPDLGRCERRPDPQRQAGSSSGAAA